MKLSSVTSVLLLLCLAFTGGSAFACGDDDQCTDCKKAGKSCPSPAKTKAKSTSKEKEKAKEAKTKSK